MRIHLFPEDDVFFVVPEKFYSYAAAKGLDRKSHPPSIQLHAAAVKSSIPKCEGEGEGEGEGKVKVCESRLAIWRWASLRFF
jgi:hypothetical protein